MEDYQEATVCRPPLSPLRAAPRGSPSTRASGFHSYSGQIRRAGVILCSTFHSSLPRPFLLRTKCHCCVRGLTTVHFVPIFIPWSTAFRCSDFCWRAVEPHGWSGGGITIVPEPNGYLAIACPWASRVAMRTHNRKIRFSPWH